MNGFTKKSVGTLTLGEKLKKLRLDRRMALNEASRITRIQTKYLEYLEEGAYDKLPADVYVRGFLRSYADFLGVDEQILLKLYEKEKEIKKNIEQDKKGPDSAKKPLNISSFVFTPKKIAVIAVAVFGLFGIFMLYREIGSFSDAPRLVIISPEDNTETFEAVITVEGFTDGDASLFINNQSVLVGDDGKFREDLTLQAGLNSINIRAVNKFEKASEKNLAVQSKKEEEVFETVMPENQPETAAQKISLEVKVDPGPVWLSVEADGNTVFSGTMLSGAVQTFSAQDRFSISSGKGDATFLVFNGKDIGALSSEPRAVKEATFDRNTKY